MKKSFFLMLAAAVVALCACQSKPAASEQNEEQQPAEQIVAEPVEEAPAEAPAEEPEPALESEEPAEEPAAEPAAEVDEEEPVFSICETQPVPALSAQELMRLLTFNVKDIDPEAEPCRVVVSVIVEKDGSVSHPQFVREPANERLGEYALRAVEEKLPRFKQPGMQRGQPVRAKFLTFVSFVAE